MVKHDERQEEALLAANNNDLTLFDKLIKILEKPYQNQKDTSDYQLPAPLSDENYQTFCGT